MCVWGWVGEGVIRVAFHRLLSVCLLACLYLFVSFVYVRIIIRSFLCVSLLSLCCCICFYCSWGVVDVVVSGSGGTVVVAAVNECYYSYPFLFVRLSFTSTSSTSHRSIVDMADSALKSIICPCLLLYNHHHHHHYHNHHHHHHLSLNREG